MAGAGRRRGKDVDKTPMGIENMRPMESPIQSLKFDASGLIPCVVQDVANGQVLMVAWMNQEALEKTLATGKIHTYSRSRGRLALKGEQSGHFQIVKQVLTDCDRDVVLFKVEQIVAACHEGYRSCFFREYQPGTGEWKTVGQKAFDPGKVYHK
jgi:phosphoribosyl-AMP cyclohydrolase